MKFGSENARTCKILWHRHNYNILQCSTDSMGIVYGKLQYNIICVNSIASYTIRRIVEHNIIEYSRIECTIVVYLLDNN